MGMNGGATPTRPELPKQAYKPKVKMGAVSIATAPDLMVGTKMRNMPASFAAGMVSKAKPGAPALASGGIMGLAGSIASKVSPAPAGGSKARSEILRNKLKDFNKK